MMRYAVISVSENGRPMVVEFSEGYRAGIGLGFLWNSEREKAGGSTLRLFLVSEKY